MRPSLLFLVCVTPFGSMVAQQPAGGLVGHAMGVSIDRFMYGSSGVVAMTYRFSTLRPGQLGAELGVSLFPQTLPAGVLVLAPDVGPAYNLPLPGGSLLLKAGGSAFAAIGTGGLVLVPGFHLGGTIVVQTEDRSAVRIDVIRHHYLPSGGKVHPVWSIGLGFAVLPRLSR